MGVVLVRGFSPRDVMTQYMAPRDLALGRQGLQPPLRRPERGRHRPDLDARRPDSGHGRDRSGRPDAEEGPRRDDLIGDGGTSTGAFHEGINFAAVQKLPLVVIAENNG